MESNPNNVQNNESEKKRENLNLSESIKLKIIKEINNSLNNNQEPINIPEIMTQEKIRQIDEKDKILNYIQDSEFYVDSKKYSNSIIIGSFLLSSSSSSSVLLFSLLL